LNGISRDILLFEEEFNCGLFKIKINDLKSKIETNISVAKEMLLSSFKEIIKNNLIKGEKQYLVLHAKLLEPMSNIVEFIEKNEYFHSFTLIQHINDIQSSLATCEKINKLLEKNSFILETKLVSKLFVSYGWILDLKRKRQKFELDLKLKRPVFEHELQVESTNIANEVEKLRKNIELLNKFADIEKSYDHQEVNLNNNFT